MLQFIITLTLVIITILLWWKWHTTPSSGEPPILPGCWPVIGHMHLFTGSTTDFWNSFKYLSEEVMKMGHAGRMYFGPVKVYALSDPDEMHKFSNICLEKDTYSYKFTKDLLGNGLLFAPVPMWKKQRKLINPTFNQHILDTFMSSFNNQAKRLVISLQMEVDKGFFDHSRYVRPMFMETICLTAMDNAVTEEEARKYIKCFETYLNIITSRFLNLFYHPDFIFKFTNKKKQLDECSVFMTELCDKVLKKKRAEKCNRQGTNTEPSNKIKALMDLLIEVDDEVLTDHEIRDEINTIIMAGHDTSGNVTVFILLLLGSYPEVQERLYEELKEVLGDKEDVDRQDLSKLVYTEAVIKETLRYYVMTPFLARYVDREIKLNNCYFKPGYNCVLSMYAVHRNAQWGPDVNEFRPERWLDPATMPTNPNLFVGFSTGKRNCIGKNYAMMSMKTVICHVLRRYKIHAHHTKMVLKLDVLLKPVSGHFIAIEDRLK